MTISLSKTPSSNIGYPNHFAPDASQPASAKNMISSFLNFSVSIPKESTLIFNSYTSRNLKKMILKRGRLFEQPLSVKTKTRHER